ncbi:MAG: ABC transporter substrate-binding protein [Anaerolineae bacterium]|nr:ABC transporter substrate-binding protein [Anaerolineae bacterium]
MEKMNRRKFLKVSALAAAGAAAVACQPQTVIVKETVEVEKVVEKTVEVEKIVEKTVEVEKEVRMTVEVEKLVTATPSAVREAPELFVEVSEGKLAPLDERLTADPLILEPVNEIGQYGGTWRRASTGMGDVGANMERADQVCPFFWTRDATGVAPDMFSTLEIGDEGASYTFGLRRGHHWSDGTPFTADDVMWLYESQWQDPDLSPNGIGGWLAIGGEPVVVEKLDDFTVKFSFVMPYGLFMLWIAHVGSGIVDCPSHYMQQFHAQFAEKAALDTMVAEAAVEAWDDLYWIKNNWRENAERPTNRGWKVVNPPRAGAVTFNTIRNPYYFKIDPDGNQLPYINEQRYTFVETAEMLHLKAIAGELDMQLRTLTLGVYPLLAESAEKGDYRLILWENFGTGMVVFPNLTLLGDDEVAALNNDIRWRHAISHAIDRDEINELIYLGLAGPAESCYPESMWGEEALWEPFEYNPEKANQLLDELGLDQRDANGWRLLPSGAPLSITLEGFDQDRSIMDASELVMSKMQAVGINTALKGVTYDQWWDRIYTSEYQITTYMKDNSGPLLQPVYARAYACSERSTYWAPEWGFWYQTNGESGVEPTGEPRQLQLLFDEVKVTADEGKRIELFTQIYHDSLAFFPDIITAGRSPAPGVVKNNMGNVPDKSYSSYPLRTPWVSSPDQYYYKS